ncbi:MAG: ABC transporter substrate-binding protein [Actinomycetota bacterium]
MSSKLLARTATPEIVGDLTRREFIIGLTAAGLLAACGRDPSASTTTTTSSTRSFVDARGLSVEVPDRPQRIVALHDINAGGHLLSLGAPVVGIAHREEPRADLTRYFDLAAILQVGMVYEPNVEAIAALQPDLMVGEGFDAQGMFSDNDAVQKSLDAIAPVVFIDTFRPVEVVMDDFARLLGPSVTATADQQRAELEATVGRIRALLGDRWRDVTASFVFSRTDTFDTSGARALPPTDVLTRAGVSWVPLVEEADKNGGHLGEISLERIGEADADLLLVATAHNRDLPAKPVYQALGAVRAGRVIELDQFISGSHYRNYLFVATVLLDALTRLGPELLLTP